MIENIFFLYFSIFYSRLFLIYIYIYTFSMISIQKALKNIIGDSPFLEDGIYHWYINFSSFADYILPRVEQITKKKVTVSSIKMGLTEYSRNSHKSIQYKRFSIEDFYIKKNIKVIYMDKNSETTRLIHNIYGESFSTESYLAVISWWREIWVIYDAKLAAQIEWHISPKYRKLELEKLSAIGIYLDDDAINQSGILYTTTKKLNFSNINIIELVSNFTEVAFIIQKKDLKKSLEVLLV